MQPSRDALLRRIRTALPAWYRRHRRDLPWRRRRDAYAIWVSEIMLQQTRVATVVPYFQRWMRRFPDVRTLAAAGVRLLPTDTQRMRAVTNYHISTEDIEKTLDIFRAVL